MTGLVKRIEMCALIVLLWFFGKMQKLASTTHTPLIFGGKVRTMTGPFCPLNSISMKNPKTLLWQEKSIRCLVRDMRLTHCWAGCARRGSRPTDQTLWGWCRQTFFRWPSRSRQWSRRAWGGRHGGRTPSRTRGHMPLTQLWEGNDMILTVKYNTW